MLSARLVVNGPQRLDLSQIQEYNSTNGNAMAGPTTQKVSLLSQPTLKYAANTLFSSCSCHGLQGVWLRPTPSSHPVLTLFGSTNLNSRSANLDTELSFMLVTSSPSLRCALAEEVEYLRHHARPWQGDKRKVRFGTRVLVAMTGGML